MFDLLRRANLTVSTDRQTYRPGDEVRAQTAITALKETAIRQETVDLVCATTYTYRTRHDEAGESYGRAVAVTTTDELRDSGDIFVEGRVLAAGEVFRREVVLHLSRRAPGTVTGKLTKVEWKVRAAAEISNSLDPKAEVPIVVLSPPDSYAAWQLEENTVTRDCTMRFNLHQGRMARVGGRLAGDLTIRAEDHAKGRLRLELRRIEHVPRNLGNALTVVASEQVLAEATELQPGVPQQFLFGLAVPPDAAPSLRTEHGSISWALHGILDRGRLRRDYESDYEVILYTE